MHRKKSHYDTLSLLVLPDLVRKYIVELEGVEPSSRRGTNAVSTCVVTNWFSCRGRLGLPTAALALKNFGGGVGRTFSYFRYTCTAVSASLGKRAAGRCLVSATLAEIKLIYYASIRQRERSCFRHLKEVDTGY